MALIPANDLVTIGQPVATMDESELPSRTYRINWDTKRGEGYVDGLNAIEQAVYKRLETERFRFPIYSWKYGSETGGLVGQSMAVAQAEIGRVITEALEADARIVSVSDFVLRQLARDSLAVSFVVHTIFGPIEQERTVRLYA